MVLWHTLRRETFLDWPSVMHALLVFFISVAWLIMINSLVFSEQSAKIIRNAREISDLQHKLSLQQQLIFSMRQQQVKHVTAADDLLEGVQAMNLPELINQLDAMAMKNHLEINALKPLSSQQMQGFNVQPLQVKLLGRYEDLLAFMHDIGALPMLISMGDFKFVTRDATDTQETHAVQLWINVYAYAPGGA